MKWEMISAIGQILGAIGVIISLVYLAIQIRRAKQGSRTAAMNALVSHFSDVMISPVKNVDFCALWMRGLRSFDELDGASKLRFGSHLECKMRTADSLCLHFLDGTLDPRLWSGFDRSIADIAAYPGFQNWWPTRKQWYSDELRALTDKHVHAARPRLYDD